MIYHEIALEPTSLEDLKDLGLLERQFGYEHGRIIAFMPAKPKDKACWWRQFHDHLKAITPIEKHKELEIRAIKLLKQITYRSRNRSTMEDGKSWIDLAIEQDALQPFSAIICAEEQENAKLLPFQSLYSPDERVPEFLKEPIHLGETMKDPEEFFRSIEPLINSAKQITIVDPYFDPSNPDPNNRRRWKNTVRKLAEFLWESKRHTIDIAIHTHSECDRDPQLMVNDIGHVMKDFFPATTNLVIAAWSQKHKGPRMHARYVITDKAGIALDYGVDVAPGLRTDVVLMPASKAQERLSEFNMNSPTLYDFEASCVVAGTRT